MTTADYEHNVVLATTKYDVVGSRPIRHDGADNVTGRALYGADVLTADPPHAAVANAIHGALGVRMRRLPMNPPKVMQALWDHRK